MHSIMTMQIRLNCILIPDNTELSAALNFGAQGHSEGQMSSETNHFQSSSRHFHSYQFLISIFHQFLFARTDRHTRAQTEG